MSRSKVLEVIKRINGNRPEIIKNSVTVSDYIEMRTANEDLLPIDVALRVAAIRETFEETGMFKMKFRMF